MLRGVPRVLAGGGAGWKLMGGGGEVLRDVLKTFLEREGTPAFATMISRNCLPSAPISKDVHSLN